MYYVLKTTFITILFVSSLVTSSFGQTKEMSVEYNQVAKNINFPPDFDSKKAKQIISALAIEKDNINQNGRIVTINGINLYLNHISEKLLINDKELLSKIKVSCLKNLSANAVSFLDGSIYINQGLLYKLKNESELAFIIGHEIAHIKKQHALKEILRQNQVDKQEINSENQIGKNYRMLTYSKESEYEADGIALSMVIQAGYNPSHSIKALEALNTDSMWTFNGKVTDILARVINNDLEKVDTSEWKNSYRRLKNDGVSLTGNSTDQFSTHPDISKRIIALREQIAIYEKNQDVQTNRIKTQSQFNDLKLPLNVNILKTALDEIEYQTAILFALQNIETTQTVNDEAILLKSLYFIALSKQNKYDKELLNKVSIAADSNMLELNNMLVSYNSDKFKKLVYGYAVKLYEQNKSNEEIHFYYALCNELFLGQQTSKIIFQNIQNKYPSGKYAQVIKARLN